MRNPSLCVLPCQREEHGAMSRGRGKSVRSCDGTWLGASQNNHHYWRSGEVRWRYPSSLMPAVRGTWQVTGAYQGEPSPGTDGGGGRGTRPAQPRRRRPRRNRPRPPGRSRSRARPCACPPTVTITILYWEASRRARRTALLFLQAVRARAGRGHACHVPGEVCSGADAAAEAVRASFLARLRRPFPGTIPPGRPRSLATSPAPLASARTGISSAHLRTSSNDGYSVKRPAGHHRSCGRSSPSPVTLRRALPAGRGDTEGRIAHKETAPAHLRCSSRQREAAK